MLRIKVVVNHQITDMNMCRGRSRGWNTDKPMDSGKDTDKDKE
jgi:hypothetical protein